MPEIIENVIQGSEAWFELRRGIPTASEFKRFMDDEFNLKQPKTKKAQEAGELNEAVYTYVCEKVAERLCGPMLDYQSEGKFDSFAIQQGKLMEPFARKWFELEMDCEIKQVAFVKSDDGLCGCSPDGLLGFKSGLELKCPQPVNQVRYVLDGLLPYEYRHQVYGSLYVTKRVDWHFVSYNETLPNPGFHIVTDSDNEIMSRINKSVAQLCALIDEREKTLRTPAI